MLLARMSLTLLPFVSIIYLPADLPDYTLCPNRAVVDKFLKKYIHIYLNSWKKIYKSSWKKKIYNHVGHWRRSKDELIIDILLWTSSHGHVRVGRPRTYLQLCKDKGCCFEDPPKVMDYRDKCWKRVSDIWASCMTWLWWWWWYIYIYIYMYTCLSNIFCLIILRFLFFFTIHIRW